MDQAFMTIIEDDEYYTEQSWDGEIVKNRDHFRKLIKCDIVRGTSLT
jgi:hypothetical protein